MNKKVAIIDYGMGNLFSVQNACENVGLSSIITNDPKEIYSASGVILPGVGAFGDAMENLEKLNLVAILKEYIYSGKPFVGICLGMQLLFSESEEFGVHKGLDIIKGKVVRFPANDKEGKRNKIPHMGWNTIFSEMSRDKWENSFLSGINNHEYMYFVHSYYCIPAAGEVVLTTSVYAGVTFCSSVVQDNIFAVQYHPEKSGVEGIKMYKNIAKFIQ